MDAFRHVLATYKIDGIWLDYHHSHASWEQAVPKMPDTCFCPNCLAKFQATPASSCPRGPSPNSRNDSWARIARAGCSGAATCSPTGSANFAIS